MDKKKNPAKDMKVAPKGTRKDSPALQKKEEKLHRDLDHDGEKGEPMAHRIKVLGKAKAEKGAEKKPAKAKK